MLFFIPLCSVIPALFRSYVKNRLGEQGSPTGEMAGPPPPPSRQWAFFPPPFICSETGVQIGRPVLCSAEYFY